MCRLHQRFQFTNMSLEKMVTVKYSFKVSTARNANSSFIFRPKVFIIGITIAYQDQCYDLGVKGQGHIYLDFSLLHEVRTYLPVFEGVYIWHNDGL